MVGYGMDFYALVVMGLCALIAGAASWLVKLRINQYHKVPNKLAITGREVALKILEANGITNVEVESVGGWLTDHYSPSEKKLRLSPEIGEGKSISSLAVAAHEVGHAIQDARSYSPLILRSAAVPLANFGPPVGMYVLIPLGLALGSLGLVKLGLLLYACVFIFQVITLPVEFNASARALQQVEQLGLCTSEDYTQARKVLTAAALTYVAAAITTLLWLLYYAWRLGLLGNRR